MIVTVVIPDENKQLGNSRVLYDGSRGTFTLLVRSFRSARGVCGSVVCPIIKWHFICAGASLCSFTSFIALSVCVVIVRNNQINFFAEKKFFFYIWMCRALPRSLYWGHIRLLLFRRHDAKTWNVTIPWLWVSCGVSASISFLCSVIFQVSLVHFHILSACLPFFESFICLKCFPLDLLVSEMKSDVFVLSSGLFKVQHIEAKLLNTLELPNRFSPFFFASVWCLFVALRLQTPPVYSTNHVFFFLSLSGKSNPFCLLVRCAAFR